MSNKQAFINWVAKSRKALLAGAFVFVSTLSAGANGGITFADVLTAVGAALASGGVTYVVPNRKS